MQDQNTFDAIVVGSGITGGWAAKELTEKGLKTLVLERGRQVEHIKDYPTEEPLLEMHTQIGVDDCSTDLDLRGKPVFRGLIGPMPDGKNIVRYESPDVFEALTKEWVAQPAEKKTRRRKATTQQPKE